MNDGISMNDELIVVAYVQSTLGNAMIMCSKKSHIRDNRGADGKT